MTNIKMNIQIEKRTADKSIRIGLITTARKKIDRVIDAFVFVVVVRLVAAVRSNALARWTLHANVSRENILAEYVK